MSFLVVATGKMWGFGIPSSLSPIWVLQPGVWAVEGHGAQDRDGACVLKQKLVAGALKLRSYFRSAQVFS